MIDRFTRWPEAIPLQDCTANTVAKMFFTHWVARFGAPRLITTDQGSQFEAQLFDTLTKLIGSKRCRTTAYHPESNGIIERWHRSLKTALMCHGETQWTDTLPIKLYNCSHVFCRVEGNRRPLDQPYTGPHKVLERISDQVFAIEIDGKPINVTVDRLKPAYVLIQDSETLPSTASSSSTDIPMQGGEYCGVASVSCGAANVSGGAACVCRDADTVVLSMTLPILSLASWRADLV
ncbi:PREDICTED: uncharacterized protein LOC105145940 [Acromyrmex echinatior]|uniref:uncharacterized protein LOC105145940 n=1 Tax=Acromyrmex echinatior TaxID=103372 RepID=UPI000580EE4C|nr:PREDICTED: uncharacterized protein LOC105145940 [Acromyrmex echinatior]